MWAAFLNRISHLPQAGNFEAGKEESKKITSITARAGLQRLIQAFTKRPLFFSSFKVS